MTHIHIPKGMITEAGRLVGNGISALGKGIRALTVTESRLLLSCRKNDIEKVKTLLDKGVDVNACGADGKTALMIAVLGGNKNFNLVNLLLKYKTDVNAMDYHDNTALILASWRGAYDIVDSLIRNGADVNAANRKGWTGLMRAVLHGYYVTAGILLENGADKNKKNKRGKKALDILRGNHKAMNKFRGKKALRLLEQAE